MAYEALRHYSTREMTLPLRLQRRRHRLRRGDARPRPGRDAVRRLVEDVHDARDDDQRAHRARLGARRARATRRRSRSTSSRSRPTPSEVAKFGIDTDEHVRVLGLGRRPLLDGLGDRALDDARDRARALRRDARRLPRHGRALPRDAARAEPAGADGPARPSGTATSSAPRRSRCCPTSSTCKRFPAYLQQLTMESNGKHVTLDGDRVDYETGADLLGRARHQRPALLLPADPPGDEADPVRLHRLHAAAEPARRPPRPADRERLRPDRGARVRQDAPTRCARRGRRRRWCRTATFEGNRPSNTILAERADAAHARAASSRSTSTASSPRARSGGSTRSTSGASSSARCSRSGSSPSSRAADEPELGHDSSTNALIRRYRAARRGAG